IPGPYPLSLHDALPISIAMSIIGMAGVVIDRFQGAAANGRFGEAPRACVQCRQALVQAQIARSLWQGGEQWPQRLGWHVIRYERSEEHTSELQSRGHLV